MNLVRMNLEREYSHNAYPCYLDTFGDYPVLWQIHRAGLFVVSEEYTEALWRRQILNINPALVGRE